jgi:hypothetical protein
MWARLIVLGKGEMPKRGILAVLCKLRWYFLEKLVKRQVRLVVGLFVKNSCLVGIPSNGL